MCLNHTGRGGGESWKPSLEPLGLLFERQRAGQRIRLKTSRQGVKNRVITARVYPLQINAALTRCASAIAYACCLCVCGRGRSQRPHISPINIPHWFLRRSTPERQVTGATWLNPHSLTHRCQRPCTHARAHPAFRQSVSTPGRARSKWSSIHADKGLKIHSLL